jgi:hypothetical protein
MRVIDWDAPRRDAHRSPKNANEKCKMKNGTPGQNGLTPVGVIDG